MNFYRRLSLRQQIRLLFGLTTILILSASICFYTIALDSLLNREERYMYNILAQVAERTDDITISVELLSDSVVNSTATRSLLRETNSVKRWDYQRTINTLISDIADSNPSISNILLLNTTSEVYSFAGTNYSLLSKLNAQYDLYSRFSHPDGFTGVLYDSDSDTPYFCHIQTVFDSSENTKIGTCLILCNCEPLYKICSNTKSTEKSLFMILDADNQVIIRGHEKNTDLESQIIDSILSTDEQMYSDTVDGKSYLLSQYPQLELTGWKVISATPYSEISSNLTRFQWFAFLLFLLFIVAFAMLEHQTIANIISPLNRIVNFIKKGPYYNLHNRIHVSEQNEIGELADQINQMLEQIQELTSTSFRNQTRMYEIKLAHDRAKLSALQSQINPHFLYNTLDSIQGLSYLGKTDEIRTVISALSTLTRYSIKGDDMVCIEEELRCIQKYLQIINIRFPDRFTFSVCILDEILEYKMPRFLLQPLVENAIFHGLEPRPGKGCLTLNGELRDDCSLHFECRDDGVGISPDEFESLQKAFSETSDTYSTVNHQHIGLLNIHQRLRLIYGPPFGLSIASSPGEGTVVFVDFLSEPLKDAEALLNSSKKS